MRRPLPSVLSLLLSALLLCSCGGKNAPEPPEGPTDVPAAEAAADPSADPVFDPAHDPDAPARFADSTEVFTLRTARQRSDPDRLGVTLCLGTVPLPRVGNLFYLPIAEPFSPELLLNLRAEGGEGDFRILLEEHLCQIGAEPLLKHNTPTEICVYSETEYAVCDLVFTTLPILSLDPEKKHLGREDTPAAFAIWEPKAGGLRYETSAATAKVRGASSASLAKTGFKFELLGEDGDTRNLSLCGMRKDDDWILYASYSDNAHVRDMVGWRLWKRMTETSGALTAAPLGAEYVELILGGEYYGLYVLMEKVDAKTFPLDAERGDSLFKCISWDIPDSRGLARQGDRSGSYSSMEKKYPAPEDGIGGSWDNLAEYVRLSYEADGGEFAEKIGGVADVDNMLEYWLFVNLTMAADNTWKNTYYATVDGKMTAYPWDLDITFGLGWNGDPANNYLYEQPGMDKRTYDFQCGRRLIKYLPGAADYVKTRWEQLLSERIADADTLIADAREFWDLLHRSGAWERNLDRWPSTNSTDSLDYFEKTVRAHTEFFDEYIRSLP